MESPSRNTLGKGADPRKGLHTEKKSSSLRARTHTGKGLAGYEETERGPPCLWCKKCYLEKQSPRALSWATEAGGWESPEQQDEALQPHPPRWQKGACFWELSLARGKRQLTGLLGDDAAQGTELTSYHWLYQPLCGRMQKSNHDAHSAGTALAQTYSSAVVSGKMHPRGARNKDASEGSGSCLSRSIWFALYLWNTEIFITSANMFCVCGSRYS